MHSSVQTGIVLQYFCSPGSALQSFDHSILLKLLSSDSSSVQTSIVLQYFCSPGSALQSFDQWIQQRLLWWRKKSYTPHLIECSTVLEHCLMACLCDAYTESTAQKGKKSPPTEKLNLHPKIAPYKLSIVSSSKSRSNEIQEVASYINKDLRNVGIDVFHAKDSLSVEDQFIRNDMMGLPYTAILSEGTLESGTIELRNKDTTLKEKIHLTQLKEIILKNIDF
ncbi:POLG2 [Mytilus coruscus]|uniref:POLG2 n=1 Tax=Mytilus coruscus TaxID=42192 RepID=A0A6J8B4Y4_MYTCO|nr:POLG2 [Mytilus coruscus]